MSYVHGASTQKAAFAQLRAQVETLTRQLETATSERDTANRSARKYKALYEKGNVEIRNSTAAEMNRLLERTDELEREARVRERHIQYLSGRINQRGPKRDPAGTSRLLDAVAEAEELRPQGRRRKVA